MPPKFQSSFIPKGPVATGLPLSQSGNRPRQKDFLSFIVGVVFALSVLLALGVFGYKYFLNYQIKSLGQELEDARAALAPDTVNELIRLDGRIVSTERILSEHKVLSPVFEFLEASTPKTVRFTNFSYTENDQGMMLVMRGEAQGYAALALQADLIGKSPYFKSPVFSDLNLDDKGRVAFSLSTLIDPTLLSYERDIESLTQSLPQLPVSTITPIQ